MRVRSKTTSVYQNVWRGVGEEFVIHADDFHPDVHDRLDPLDPPVSDVPLKVEKPKKSSPPADPKPDEEDISHES